MRNMSYVRQKPSVNLTLCFVILSLSSTVLKSDIVSIMLIHANEP